jgi:peptide chain release factor 1
VSLLKSGPVSSFIFVLRLSFVAAGGTEAALFATELQEVLTAYCAHRRWDYDVISSSTIGRQTKEAIVSVDGASYADLYFESGVHRVQRVPDTDSQGRIHTSTVTIAVLPKYRSGSVTLDEKDIRMDVYRSSGPGGQNANKTNSAVRLVHIPTGLTVCMQDERSQSQNKVLALRVLQYRVEQRAYTESLLRKQANRSEQVALAVFCARL